jgi:sterol 24-C-methyltransferase
MTTSLPKERDDLAFGQQIRSHYTVEENSDQPVDIARLEGERQKRKDNYAQISHEQALQPRSEHDHKY